MSVDAATMDILEWPHTQRPPDALVPVVLGLLENSQRIVTLPGLDVLRDGHAPSACGTDPARARVAGPDSARVGLGAPVRLGTPVPRRGFDELLARLQTHPATPAAIAGRSSMEVREWLKMADRHDNRPATRHPGAALPAGLQAAALESPQGPARRSIEDIPVWSTSDAAGLRMSALAREVRHSRMRASGHPSAMAVISSMSHQRCPSGGISRSAALTSAARSAADHPSTDMCMMALGSAPSRTRRSMVCLSSTDFPTLRGPRST